MSERIEKSSLRSLRLCGVLLIFFEKEVSRKAAKYAKKEPRKISLDISKLHLGQ